MVEFEQVTVSTQPYPAGGRMARSPVTEGLALSPEMRAWMAGFFEGEGCISVTKPCLLWVRVSQIDREPLDLFHRLCGGTIRKKSVRGNRKPSSEWATWNNNAVRFLLAIQDFVVRARVKDRIRMAIEFQEVKEDGTLPKDEQRRRLDALYLAFKQHNTAGLVGPAVSPVTASVV